MAKIVFFSEMDFRGSGYTGITQSLCKGLAELGHDIKVLAFTYHNEEHEFPFSILGVNGPQEAVASFHNLMYVWQPDILIVALDIPYHEKMIGQFKGYGIPYIAITPLESDPLCMSWAMILMQADKTFFISQFGADEAEKLGIPAEHIQVGVDTVSWRIPTPEEKRSLRQSLLGIEDDDTFVILTVADNQERKNLSAAVEIVGKFKEDITDNLRYVLVTREHLQIGWRLGDLSAKHGLTQHMNIFDRERTEGIPFRELWALYACADCFLLTSKGEGLGLPVLEAMSVGVPVVATDAGACTEHIQRGGGWLMRPAFVHCDPYGNANRYYVDVMSGVDCLVCVHQGMSVEETVRDARAYVESRTWDIPVNQLDNAIKEVLSRYEQKKAEATAVAVE